MGVDRALLRELVPFAAATALAFAFVPIGGGVDWGGYAVAAILMAAIGCAILFVPWERLPPMVQVAPALAYLVSLGFLREVSGVMVGVGVLALVPVFWVSLHGTRSQLLLIVAGICLFFVAPDLPDGEPEQHPISIWRIALVFGAASAIVGIAVQNLVARVRGHAAELEVRERDLEAVADLLRSLPLTADARERICAGVCDLSGARFAVLLEPARDVALERTAAGGDAPPGDVLQLGDDDRPAALHVEPIHHGDKVTGLLVAGWSERPSDERRAQGLVRILASEAAFVIERSDLLGQLTEYALTDDLTGLPNRRAWDEQLEQALRDPAPVCVAVLDIDNFKAYNDEHGHQAGDRFLKEAAAAWRAELRPTDTLARYGGEEFLVLLREGDVDAARGIVDRLRAATPRDRSCSAGIARREAGETSAALLGRADDALYEAKRAGRDRSLTA